MIKMRLAVGALVLATVVGCQSDPFADYCDEVSEQQLALSEALGEGGPTALIKALPSFEALREKSPPDIRDEWDTVVTRIRALSEAIEAAGVDPETYTADDPPADLDPALKARIDAAADQLASPAMADALDGVQQQARDVCKNPLSL